MLKKYIGRAEERSRKNIKRFGKDLLRIKDMFDIRDALPFKEN